MARLRSSERSIAPKCPNPRFQQPRFSDCNACKDGAYYCSGCGYHHRTSIADNVPTTPYSHCPTCGCFDVASANTNTDTTSISEAVAQTIDAAFEAVDAAFETRMHPCT